MEEMVQYVVGDKKIIILRIICLIFFIGLVIIGFLFKNFYVAIPYFFGLILLRVCWDFKGVFNFIFSSLLSFVLIYLPFFSAKNVFEDSIITKVSILLSDPSTSIKIYFTVMVILSIIAYITKIILNIKKSEKLNLNIISLIMVIIPIIMLFFYQIVV